MVRFTAMVVAALLFAPAAWAQGGSTLAGDWSGTLAVGGGLRVIFHIRGTPGAWTATLDSPDQGATGIPVTSVTETGDEVVIELSALKAGFHGKHAGDSLDGTFAQGGGSIPMTLKRGVPEARVVRPQTPVKPYPYREEEVAFDNAAGPAHLTGTLTLPAGKGPFPAVMLITGSGQQDRDETIFQHHPFLIWADYLTRRGIAVLRVDDRGMGGSTGEVLKATSADFATDIEAGVAYLRTRPDIDRRRVGLMGHSEGGMIAPMVAAKDPQIAFIVLLAGPGITGEETSLSQNRAIAKASGETDAQVEAGVATSKLFLDAVKDAPDQATADARLHDAWVTYMKQQGQPETTPMPAEIRRTSLPWIRFFLSYDPVPTLERVRCPVLAINGSKDLQVLPDLNLAGIRRGLTNSPDTMVVELPGLNHLLQTAGTGQLKEYATIEETVSPAALKTVGDWMVARAKP